MKNPALGVQFSRPGRKPSKTSSALKRFGRRSRGTDLYSITLQDTYTPNPICLIAKATSSQAWLWHRRLSYLNFDTINLLSKNDILIVESINRKKYVLVIIDNYSRYTWTHFLRSKDETPEVLIDFLTLVQRGLHAQVRTVRTDKGTEFLNKTLHEYFAKEGIRHETSTARTPEQTWRFCRKTETVLLLRLLSNYKTPYHTINARKPSVKFFHIFGSLCYIVKDGENLDKMKEKGDACIFVGSLSVLTVSQCLTMALELDSLSPGPQSQENVPHAADTVTTSNELDFLFSLMFNELLNGNTPSCVNVFSLYASIEHFKQTPEIQVKHPTQAHNCHCFWRKFNQAEINKENAQVEDDEFINIFSTPVQEGGETLSRYVDSSNMHTFYQRHPSEHRWT
ncbi:retrovirus-related pol polyprotein from transposon TNT 1-94 [Tanacetum coccineum]